MHKSPSGPAVFECYDPNHIHFTICFNILDEHVLRLYGNLYFGRNTPIIRPSFQPGSMENAEMVEIVRCEGITKNHVDSHLDLSTVSKCQLPTSTSIKK
jgi:hypothetical protein